MNRFPVLVAQAVVLSAVWVGGLQAQPFGPGALGGPVPGGLGAPSRPAFSPYLNLARPGAPPAVNYYGLVRPQQQFQQSIQNLQGAVATNQQAIGGLQTAGAGLPVTGHATQFMNAGGYFMTNGQASSNQNPAFLQGNRFNTNIRSPQPGTTGVNPGAGAPRR